MSSPAAAIPIRGSRLDQIPDSGYNTAEHTPNDIKTNPTLQRTKSIALSGHHDVQIWKKKIDEAAIARFHEIITVIDRLLLEHIQSAPVTARLFSPSSANKGEGKRKHRPMAIRLLALGKTEDDAVPCMVVFCAPLDSKRVASFFKTALARELCAPEDPTLPSFKVVVHAEAPRIRSGDDDVEILVDDARSADATFCGMPIRVCHPKGASRVATFGGIVKAVNAEGGVTLYGMTAGHVCEGEGAWEDEEADEFETTDGLDEVIDFGASTDDQQDLYTDVFEDVDDDYLPTPLSSAGRLPRSESWHFDAPRFIGKLRCKSEDPLVDDEEPRRRYDWALFDLDDYKVNQFTAPEKSEHFLPAMGIAWDGQSLDVRLLSGSHGLLKGQLSKLPGAFMLGTHSSFVNAYLLTLDDNHVEVCNGDSGSWVASWDKSIVYGHVVATDAFGDAYVIPLTDTLADMKLHLGAESVDLPTPFDIATAKPSTLSTESSTPFADFNFMAKFPGVASRLRDEQCESDSGYSSADEPRSVLLCPQP